MKVAVASLAFASFAMGELALFAPASSPVSVQCQGDCQGGGDAGGPAVAPQSAAQGALPALIREFVGGSAPTPSANHIQLEPTPIVELLYNYMNPEGAAEPLQTSAPVNRLVAAFMDNAATAAPESASEASDVEGFDFNSWGDRVNSAARRLAANVEGVVVHFLSTAESEPESEPTEAQLDEFTAATSFASVEAETSPTHWYDFF
ncbi:hypothetical protein H4S02_004285 [Coemansia sp. RSA 2611]|nr:hypothetical protein H4S02_004285 [Coemansia sp. RSA 2611]